MKITSKENISKTRIAKNKTFKSNANSLDGALDFSEIERLFQYMIPEHFTSQKYIYHYTTLDSLLGGIVPKDKNDKLCFWATDSNYMNDPKELDVDLRLFVEDTKHIDFFKTLFDGTDLDKHSNTENTFLLSFSENKDSLPMWSMYGKNGDGIVLEFEKRLLTTTKNPLIKCLYPRSKSYYIIIKLLEKVLSSDENKNITKGRFFLSLDKIRYKNSPLSERKERVRKMCNCDSCSEDFVSMISLIFFPFIAHKHNAYEYERELRLIISENSPDLIKFRSRDGMLVPYIERQINRSALKSITIGPTQEFERSKKSLDMFLKSRGFDKVKIYQSNVPYRK